MSSYKMSGAEIDFKITMSESRFVDIITFSVQCEYSSEIGEQRQVDADRRTMTALR